MSTKDLLRFLLTDVKPFVVLGVIIGVITILICVTQARADASTDVFLPLVLNNNRVLPTPAPTMGTTPFPYPTNDIPK